MEIRDGWIFAPERPGHGLDLSETARRDWRRPAVLADSELGEAPDNPRLPARGTPKAKTEFAAQHRETVSLAAAEHARRMT
jgi:hypothetical protein